MAEIPFDPTEIMVALQDATAEVVQEVANAVLRTVVLASPVGDPTLWQNPKPPPGYVGGSFRKNWQVGVGDAPLGEVEGVDPSGAETIQLGAVAIAGLVKGTDDIVYIANNLPYGNRLNNGHSTQAPAGFVEQAVAAGVAGTGSGSAVL